MEWMILPFKRYADFDGRSRRLEYWMFSLFIWLVTAAALLFVFALGGFREQGFEEANGLIWVPIGALVIFYLGIFVPAIAVTVRRLHDRDMSGWFYLISFVPYIGGLILFVITVLPGTEGENRFGDDPINPMPEDLQRVFD